MVAFGLDHGLVSVVQQRVDRIAIVRKHRNANAGVADMGLPVEVHGSGHLLQDALGHLHDLPGAALGQQQHEFITRQPADQIARAQALRESLGHFAQQRVACGMAQGVVDLLEAV
ncbi:hypothetical protein D3C72_1883800 [compost metagenome]